MPTRYSRESIPEVNRVRSSTRLSVSALDLVLLQFAIQGGLADSQHASRRLFVAAGLPQGAQNRTAFQLIQRQQLLFFRLTLRGGILQIRRQVMDTHERAR